MTRVYCDIIPLSNGWCFLSEDGQSAAYPSYRLAVEAARRYSESKSITQKKTVIRQQDLRGQMLELGGSSQAWATGRSDMAGRV